MSAFALEDGVVYHTYSTYARGLDGLWGMYQWLDRAPKGRNEQGRGGAATTNTGSAEAGGQGGPTGPSPAMAQGSPLAVPRSRAKFYDHGAGDGAASAHGDPLCSSAQMSSLGGMAPMYLLMSAFHLAPWLKLIAAAQLRRINDAPADAGSNRR